MRTRYGGTAATSDVRAASPKMHGSHSRGRPAARWHLRRIWPGAPCSPHASSIRQALAPPTLDRVSGIPVREMKAPRFWAARPEPARWVKHRESQSRDRRPRQLNDECIDGRDDHASGWVLRECISLGWEGCGGSTRIANKGKRARQIGHAPSVFRTTIHATYLVVARRKKVRTNTSYRIRDSTETQKHSEARRARVKAVKDTENIERGAGRIGGRGRRVGRGGSRRRGQEWRGARGKV